VESHSLSNYHGRLLKRLGMGGSFKAYRKTSGTHLGSDHRYEKLADHFLGESPRSIADKHYVAVNARRFADAVTWLGYEFRLYEAGESLHEPEAGG
jgi:hypothetical protein